MHPLNQKLIEILPDLKELTFGCEVKLKNGEEKAIFIMENPLSCSQCKCTTGVHLKMDNPMSPQSFCKHSFEEYFEILGRPPQLHDVLRAIDKVGAGDSWSIGADGVFLECPDFDGMLVESNYSWNLSLGLNDQPESTKQFILSILNK